MTDNVILQCRALLETVTPLHDDCGRHCGGACCRSQEGEETGMLLFPGEEALYEGLDGYRIQPTENGGLLLICSGTCDRSQRPLSCRMFPLLPVIREDGIRAVMDARAAAVCPLFRMGKRGLSFEFAEAVRQCGELLMQDAAQRAFLTRLTQEHDELRALQKQFGG